MYGSQLTERPVLAPLSNDRNKKPTKSVLQHKQTGCCCCCCCRLCIHSAQTELEHSPLFSADVETWNKKQLFYVSFRALSVGVYT
jgi:hypothetical protein